MLLTICNVKLPLVLLDVYFPLLICICFAAFHSLKIMLCPTWFYFTLVESTFMEVNMDVTNWNHAQVETGDDGARCKMTGAEAVPCYIMG